jgi:Fe-S cluster assembly protein SufD
MYKGIMYDKSTGVFNGKIYVRLDAQKTAAFQQNSNIVASKGATINTKPELEIYADDVKCSHGCTVGQFDEEAMFYLNARGIDDESAKSLLVQAYIGDVLDSVKFEEIKNEVVRLYSERHGWL